MNRILILNFAILAVLAMINCNSHQQKSSGTVKVKDSITARPTQNRPSLIFAKPEVPILCYHRIQQEIKSDYEVRPSTFESHMKILADSGYHTVSPAQLYDYLVYDKGLPVKPVIITFDDSRTEHFMIAAPVMEKYQFHGVFFIMTITLNKKNYMTTEQIERLAKAGHTIGLHSWDHTMVTKYKETSDWMKQVAEPKKKLEKIVDRPVEYWAYPDGIFDHKSAGELAKYFKLSFILSSRCDSILPLQTVRRMIVTESTPQGLLKAMHRTFSKKQH